MTRKYRPLAHTAFFLIGMLAVALWVGGSQAASPTGGFSGDPMKFPEELARVVRAQGKVAKAVERQIKEFAKKWPLSPFPPETRERIVQLSRQMFRSAQANSRYFATWQGILLDLISTGQEPPYLNDFLRVMEHITQLRGQHYGAQYSYLVQMHAFFKESSLHRLPSFVWTYQGTGYQLHFEPTLHVSLHDVTLKCKAGQDSIMIHHTTGSFFPLEQRWQGHGGKVLWNRSGFGPDEVFARLASYHVNLKQNLYVADSAELTHRRFLDAPVLGRLEEQMTRGLDSSRMTYPKFTSYRNDLAFKNMISGVHFRGRCEMRGAWLIGLGSPGYPARFELIHEGKPVLRITTDQMAFSSDRIASNYAEVAIYMGQDSLYHSGLSFNYDDGKKEVLLSPTSLSITKSPMYSTYHKLTIYFDGIIWRIPQNRIIFGPRQGSSSGAATFISDNFFNQEEFDMMMGMSMSHPLIDLARFAHQIKSREFGIASYADYLNRPVQQVKHMLMDLAVSGVLLYDVTDQRVTLLPKIYNMINASARRIDYDALRFSSRVGQDRANAVLDLTTSNLEVYSVSQINVSDSQNVRIMPAGRFVTVGKNRNLKFDGQVEAGLFTFMGEGIEFNYDDYTIDLKKIDRAEFDVLQDSLDFTGHRQKRRCRSALNQLTGHVKIDEPTNKSGLQRTEGFPIFESTEPSFVYYDNPDIHGGVYNKEGFNFKVEPFVLDNLNRFEKRDIHFAGSLNTDSILTSFEDTLRIRPDLSLGFVHVTGPEGMELYNGRGRFYNDLDLSNEGLKGSGKLEYLTSVTESPEFFFYPDSVRAMSTKFDIERQEMDKDSISYPEVHGTRHGIRWKPAQERFYALEGPEAYDMYQGQSTFRGDYSLTPKGLEGKGTVFLDKAQMTSDRFEFAEREWNSDTMRANFQVPGSEETAFTSNLLAGEFNYLSRTGSFSSISASILGNMDILQYETHADHIDWSMDRDELLFTTATQQSAVREGKFRVRNMLDRDSIPAGSIFYSVKKGEDSLYFMSPIARFSLKTAQLEAEQVPYVLTADAKVKPNRGRVRISPTGRMHALQQSTIEADVERKYHRIYDATVRVYSRRSYGGLGRVDYVDQLDSILPIQLDTIYSQTPREGGHTVGSGYLAQHANFMLSPRFRFEGKVSLDARDSLLTFNGGATPVYECPGMMAERLNFQAPIHSRRIRIPLDHPQVDLNGQWLISSTVLSYDSMHVYPAFISPRFSFNDRELSRPRGFLSWDENSGRYLAADSLLYDQTEAIAQQISFDPDQCRLFTTGVIQMPFDLGRCSTHATGRVIHDATDSSLSINLFLDLNFLFSKPALENLAQRINNHPDLEKLDESREIYLEGLKERLDTAVYRKVAQEIQLFGFAKEPFPGLDGTFSFTNLRMRWDQRHRAFVSVGRLGIGSIAGIPIGRKVNGYLELRREFTGDTFTLHLELTPSDTYTFTFYATKLVANASSNPEFLEIINKTKRKNRRAPNVKNLPKYEYSVGSTMDIGKASTRYKEILYWDQNNL